MAKNKYYAVATGRIPGIYETWADCEAQVKGFPCASFKGFSDKEGAESFISDASDRKEQSESMGNPFEKEYAGRHAFIYVDGSYNKGTNKYGYGVYVEDEQSPKIFVGGDTCQYGGNNIEGEIQAATVALDYAFKSDKYDSVTICHDLKHIGLIGDRIEQPHTEYTSRYGCFVDKIRRTGLAVDFIHTKGHTGIVGNEYVDKLAKIGCDISLTKKDKSVIEPLRGVSGFPVTKRELPGVDVTADTDYDLSR